MFVFIAGLFYLSSCELTVDKDITSDYLVNGIANGKLDPYLSHNQVFRYKGTPGVNTIPVGLSNLADYEKCFVLYISSGPDPATTASSASVKLDGITVLAPIDFDNKPVSFKFEICDLTPQSLLEVEVKGTPGSFIDLWIEGKLSTTVTDVDKNIYNIVKIGNQRWMKENLKTTKFQDGSIIPIGPEDNNQWLNLTSPAYCWYNNDLTNKNEYGALYNWYAVHDGRQICPTGWQIPNEDDWKTLELSLGMSSEETELINFRGSHNEGGKLKETGTDHWLDPNTGADNSTGFTARGGGYRYGGVYGTYYQLNRYGVFWSMDRYYRLVVCDNGMMNKNDYFYETYGFSVRCIKK